MIVVQIMEKILGIKHNDSFSHERNSLSTNNRKLFCTHWKMHGHGNERCWKFHQKFCSNKGKEIVKPNAREERGGK